MKKRIYAVRDLKVGNFQSPFLDDSDASVIRSFGDVITSKDKSLFTLHPEDFALCYLGIFDCETGVFDCNPAFTVLATGSDFLKKE